ncbi:hypothetical protein VHP8226_01504 [Vibrio hippocampi]|uniref:Uncharacterized protein n=1 Tax=Vibrio hippocampi TaxID=654686 RepID=A0ABN8DFH4_9VIBR|nr:hypothetical protein VHP8226_01504 [Vibrio hippocampi]
MLQDWILCSLMVIVFMACVKKRSGKHFHYWIAQAIKFYFAR